MRSRRIIFHFLIRFENPDSSFKPLPREAGRDRTRFFATVDRNTVGRNLLFVPVEVPGGRG